MIRPERPSTGTRASGRRALPVILACSTILTSVGCARTYVMTDRGPQAYYQTSPPIRDTSAEIERIFRAVKRIQVTGIYRTHRFSLADSITDADLASPATYSRATERYTFDHTKAGTATVVSAGAGGVMLLTNEHVIRLPDTLVVHYAEPLPRSGARPQRRYVESVAILRSRTDIVVDVSGTRAFSVVAQDRANDLAALRVQFSAGEPIRGVDVLRVRRGDAARLSWASFVYVLGYPGGYKMVTRAIVSDPDRTPSHAFLLDGLFNRGISGGLILAVRAETAALEWVGLASSASAETEYLLFPQTRDLDEEGMLVPYEGPLYLERAARIHYGITFSVPITAVQTFLRAARIPLAPVLPAVEPS
ncbi:MAG: S1 family peptidase [Longimicrobiales bacterium]